jgi:DNA mismatch repair protein MutH
VSGAPRTPPPVSEADLLGRARALAGLTLAQVAAAMGEDAPREHLHAKGWGGLALERALGATAGSRASPDFEALGVELKTLPVDPAGDPLETTYVCTVDLRGPAGDWRDSWVRRKLDRVLWLPLVAPRGAPLGERRVGVPLLWAMEPDLEAVLREDWEEQMDRIALGELERLSARHGTYLQVRPKAADGTSLTRGVGPDGSPVDTLPRGFYLRTDFTREVLRRHYLLA